MIITARNPKAIDKERRRLAARPTPVQAAREAGSAIGPVQPSKVSYTITVTTNENRKAWTTMATNREQVWIAANDYARTQERIGRRIVEISIRPVQLSSSKERETP